MFLCHTLSILTHRGAIKSYQECENFNSKSIDWTLIWVLFDFLYIITFPTSILGVHINRIRSIPIPKSNPKNYGFDINISHLSNIFISHLFPFPTSTLGVHINHIRSIPIPNSNPKNYGFDINISHLSNIFISHPFPSPPGVAVRTLKFLRSGMICLSNSKNYRLNTNIGNFLLSLHVNPFLLNRKGTRGAHKWHGEYHKPYY